VQTTRTKICMLTTAYPRWPGDERAPFIHEAAKALKEAGNEVRVLAMHRPGTMPHEYMDGIEIIRTRYLPEKWEVLQEEGGGIPIVWKKKPLARLAIIPFVIAQSLALQKWSRDCDIIHANWTLSGIIAWLTQFIHHRPFVVTVHGSDIYQGTKTGWIRWLTKISLSQANAIIAVSNDLAEKVIELGIDKGIIRVIPDGIDVAKFQPEEAKKREDMILFVGSLIPRKGCKYLIHAFGSLIRKLPNYQLHFVGEGPDRPELQQLVVNMSIKDQVCFHGTLSRDDVTRFMSSAKLFVLPSLEEGLGVVILEAIASGTPCVASRIGGIPDIITEGTGRLVPPSDPAALDAAMYEILSSPEIWKSLSLACRKRAVEVFAWDRIGAQLSKLYQECAS